ncbi:MAG: DUF4129 domain-containing protein [Verrucomicrobiota bacterium]|jgi:hypothetical protein|nr:DUF4129 domain-containing protein [Verrucomicrobiota bacterium]
MRRPTSERDELRQSLPLLEEAAALLRALPPSAWVCHLLGTGPFLLALVWFWSSVSTRPAAQLRPLAWALPVALLHLWMRVWQSRFTAALFDLRAGREGVRWGAGEWARAARTQLRQGVPAFLLLGPALVASLPFGWCYAFYQSLAVTAHLPDARPRAWRIARHTPYQNHALLSWLSVCGLTACVSVASTAVCLPQAVKLFVPVEWAFTRNPFWFTSTTALCAVLALTYFVMDPLVKAVYALRAFYSLSLATGEDLLTDWRALRAAPLLALLLLAAPLAARAEAPQPAALPAAPFLQSGDPLSTALLVEQLDDALRDPRYDWRFPKEAPPARDSWLRRQLGALRETLRRWGTAAAKALRRLRAFFERREEAPFPDRPRGPGFSVQSLNAVLAVLLAAVAAALAVLLWRSRRGAPPAQSAPLQDAAPVPDLADERVTADLLPDEAWLALADRLRAANDPRKAARAFFLALLACLGHRGVIALARSKTNADYGRELRRRTAGLPFDTGPFHQAAGLFEAGWYGDHPVTGDMLDRLRGAVEGYRHA